MGFQETSFVLKVLAVETRGISIKIYTFPTAHSQKKVSQKHRVFYIHP